MVYDKLRRRKEIRFSNSRSLVASAAAAPCTPIRARSKTAPDLENFLGMMLVDDISISCLCMVKTCFEARWRICEFLEVES